MNEDMTRIVVTGAGRAYDGDYALDTERAFNSREWNWIKRIAGYMPNTVKDGFNGGDPDLYVALAVIAMAREGKIERTEGIRVAEVLAELPFDGAGIQVIFPEVEDDADPPALTSEPEQQSPNGSLEKTPSSGVSSPSGSGSQAPTPSPIGTGESAMSARRPLQTLSGN